MTGGHLAALAMFRILLWLIWQVYRIDSSRGAITRSANINPHIHHKLTDASPGAW